MRIEHIAIYVQDLEKSAAFYEQYFGGVRNRLYRNPKTGVQFYFISFTNGTRLELIQLSQPIQHDAPLTYGYAHMAFSVGSRNAVGSLTFRLINDQYDINSFPRVTGDGYYESSVFDLDDNLIEITE